MHIIIAAAAENNALGKNNNLLWHLPNDFKRFKELTTGHSIIMGRKTFESLPKLLPNRKHIVITKQTDYKKKGAHIAHTFDQAIALAHNDEQIYIIGGGEIYNLAMEFADKIELTRVYHTFEADTYFPQIDEKKWKLVKNVEHPKDEKHTYAFSYLSYVKR